MIAAVRLSSDTLRCGLLIKQSSFSLKNLPIKASRLLSLFREWFDLFVTVLPVLYHLQVFLHAHTLRYFSFTYFSQTLKLSLEFLVLLDVSFLARLCIRFTLLYVTYRWVWVMHEVVWKHLDRRVPLCLWYTYPPSASLLNYNNRRLPL